MGVPDDDDQYLEVDDVDDRAISRNGDDSSDEESESDEEVGPDERQAKVSVKDLLAMILQDIQCGKLDLTSPSHLQTFKTGDGNMLASQTGDPRQPTVLHIMAVMDKKDMPKLDSKMEPLIKHLVAHKNDILRIQDRSGHTAMYLAIEAKKEKMVQWMCDVHPDISSIIATISGDQMNCIHVGIDKKVKFLDLLVDKADAAALVAKDSKGNTPLHMAVEYKRCKREQLAIIERIVAKSDRAIQELSKLGDFNNAGRSPYLHHQDTARKAKAKDAEKEAQKHSKDGGALDKHSVHVRPDAPDAHGAVREMPAPGQRPMKPSSSPMMTPSNPLSAAEALRSERSRAVSTDTRAKYGGRAQAPATTGTLAIPSLSLPQPVEVPEDGGKKSSRQAIFGKASDSKASAEAHKSRVDEATVKNVERFLKLHYLRSRSYNAALEILYGRNIMSDLELYFDLSGHANIKQTGLENLLSKLKFEEILQYIYIPKINVETNVVAPNSKKPRVASRVKQDGAGRRDLCDIFDRLRKKGVRTILKVIVDDMDSPAHSDDAIEDALKFFDVEVWDWRRVDLCSEVIQRVSSRVREVHLYWSGNNAVLRGWAEEGGLKRLKELRDVHLHIQQGLETSARTKQNVEDFCEQMKKRCPEVNILKEWPVAHRENADLAALRAEEQAEHSTKHEWIQCMKEFRKLVYDAESYYEGPRVDESIEEPIKVAVIDDGVDVKDLKFNFIGGRTFCTRDEVHNLNAPYYVSSQGHGTIMAKQIHLLCPRAQFYVLRLEDHASEDGARQLTARSAAQAILAAVQKKVHIISMSWTIDPPEDEEERRFLDDAIARAANADILMFCSASDKGAKTGLTYPAKATTKIFTIGAADASGAADAWIGNLSNISFTFPGVKVELDGERSEQGLRDATGSSVATALAAGLAALVLYCVQVRILVAGSEAERSKARKDFHSLKRHEHMMRALKDIGTTEESNHKFIEVWEVFGKKVEEREQREQERWIDLVAEVGTTLCRKM